MLRPNAKNRPRVFRTARTDGGIVLRRYCDSAIGVGVGSTVTVKIEAEVLIRERESVPGQSAWNR